MKISITGPHSLQRLWGGSLALVLPAAGGCQHSWLVATSLQPPPSSSRYLLLYFLCEIFLFLSLIKTLVIIFRAHSDDLLVSKSLT